MSRTRDEFDGKVAIVTGAARGIGAAYARALAGHGAAVVIADLDDAAGTEVAESIRSAGGGMGIRVNAIAPGPIDTEATRKMVGGAADDIVKTLALRRMGRPEDLVGACLFLLSSEASWLTGQIVNVDGGQVFRS